LTVPAPAEPPPLELPALELPAPEPPLELPAPDGAAPPVPVSLIPPSPAISILLFVPLFDAPQENSSRDETKPRVRITGVPFAVPTTAQSVEV